MNNNQKNIQLDQTQMQLIHCNKNAIVIAGAGAGKTFTIISKIEHLITKKHISPNEILLISFTNATVSELKQRIDYPINIFTFHKLAMHILQLNNVQYSICHPNYLNYIISEYLYTCSDYEKKVILKFFNEAQSYLVFLKSQKFIECCQIIKNFINIFNTNGKKLGDLTKIMYTRNEKNFITIILKIAYIYSNEKESQSLLDFDDLIKLATKLSPITKLHLKYIIIDEFQDTSTIRFELIKSIFNNSRCKIIVVGDDWQSIYGFSGANLNLFLNFQTMIPNTEKIILNKTYRNSQELIDISRLFVEKNPYQIKKKIYSILNNKEPIFFCPYTSTIEILKKILDILINKGEVDNCMILSRNNFDILKYLTNEFSLEDNILHYKKYCIKVMTVHKSKGLEAKNVIVLNCNNDYYGFPTKIKQQRIISKTFPTQKYPYDEERRLFYVALTRCKEAVYLCYDQQHPSVFVKELKKITKKILGNIPYIS